MMNWSISRTRNRLNGVIILLGKYEKLGIEDRLFF